MANQLWYYYGRYFTVIHPKTKNNKKKLSRTQFKCACTIHVYYVLYIERRLSDSEQFIHFFDVFVSFERCRHCRFTTLSKQREKMRKLFPLPTDYFRHNCFLYFFFVLVGVGLVHAYNNMLRSTKHLQYIKNQ